MALILHIDTAVDGASICLSEEGGVLALAQNTQTRDSAGWLQPAIQDLLRQAGVQLQQLVAVSVSAGPGSSTGLRVGMASAKGLCYALQIPLIAVDTLQAMAGAALPQVAEAGALLCPMIDARRMEVFTAVYDRELQQMLAPVNMILEESSFEAWLADAPCYFFGNGSEKAKPVLRSQNARFVSVAVNATALVPLATALYRQQQFAPLAYAEPRYVKAFFSTQPTKE